MPAKTRTYSVELCFLQPMTRTVQIKARSVEEACRKAFRREEDEADFWDAMEENVHGSSVSFVSQVLVNGVNKPVPFGLGESRIADEFAGRGQEGLPPPDDAGQGEESVGRRLSAYAAGVAE